MTTKQLERVEHSHASIVEGCYRCDLSRDEQREADLVRTATLIVLMDNAKSRMPRIRDAALADLAALGS